MILELLQRKPFTVIAHRGGGLEAPENTIKGIRHGMRVGADIIEIDVRKTKDNRLILLHDSDFARVCGIEKRPQDLELAQIKETLLVFDQEPVATLEEALETIDGKRGVFIEIKEPDTTMQVIELVREKNAQNWCAIISFYDEVIEECKDIDPAITTGLVYNRPPGKIAQAKELGADFVLPHYRLATIKANRYAHSLGLLVGVWTVNDRFEMIEAYKRGVDAIASDYPKMLVHLRKKLMQDGEIFHQNCKVELLKKSDEPLYKIVLDKNHYFLEQNPNTKSRYGVAYKKLKEIYPYSLLFWEVKENDYTGNSFIGIFATRSQLIKFLKDVLDDDSFMKYEDVKDSLEE